jgi:hypothetical protein
MSSSEGADIFSVDIPPTKEKIKPCTTIQSRRQGIASVIISHSEEDYKEI